MRREEKSATRKILRKREPSSDGGFVILEIPMSDGLNIRVAGICGKPSLESVDCGNNLSGKKFLKLLARTAKSYKFNLSKDCSGGNNRPSYHRCGGLYLFDTK
jgi:hypothetical protein